MTLMIRLVLYDLCDMSQMVGLGYQPSDLQITNLKLVTFKLQFFVNCSMCVELEKAASEVNLTKSNRPTCLI